MPRPVVSMRLLAALCLAVACLLTSPGARGATVRLAPPAAASATAGPICDLFANGYDAPAAAPCATCFDLSQDLDESDVDCGGAYCRTCATGLHCHSGTDCASGTCSGGVCTDRLLLSQVQTRGDNGGNDEFVELYNPGDAAVTFDATWTVQARSAVGTCTANATATRFSGGGQVIPPHGHVLFVNVGSAGYNGTVAGDGTYTLGLTDAASLTLLQGSAVVDALCYYYDATTLNALTACAVAYPCEGTPVPNPHNNTSATNLDASLERKPGGAFGNAQDTNDNSADFAANPTPDPHNLASGPTPQAPLTGSATDH